MIRDAFASDGWNPLHLPYKYYKSGNINLAGDLIENFAKSLTKNLIYIGKNQQHQF